MAEEEDDAPEPEIVRAPREIVGYHGCTKQAASNILAGEAFLPSQNAYDWLGAGIYFWEFGPYRAFEWARKFHGDEAAVLSAKVTLGNCLNLLDPEHFDGLQRVYQKLIDLSVSNAIRLPKNTGKRHFLDRAVIEFYCEDRVAVGAEPFQTVRGCFPEGSPVYDGSRLYRETHVQIAVRDEGCISEIRQVRLPL